MVFNKPLPPDADAWRCRDLTALWLHCYCGNYKCGYYAPHSLHALIEHRPAAGFWPLGRLMRKLYCRQCGERPARVVLMREATAPPGTIPRGTRRNHVELTGR